MATKAHLDANKRYQEKLDRVVFFFRKGKKYNIKSQAVAQGESRNRYIKKAVADRYKGDTGNDIEL